MKNEYNININRRSERMYFTGEHSDYAAGLRTEFYCQAEAMISGHGMDAPEWVAAGGSWQYEQSEFSPEPHFGARTPRDCVWWCPPSCRYDPDMKTEDKKPKAHGGKRKGSGRPALDADGTVVVTVRLTGKQKATYDMLGGREWLRGQLDLFSDQEA